MDASNLLRFAGIEKMEDGSIFIYEHPNAILQYIYNSLLGKWCWMVYSYLLHICFETCILIGAVTWGVLFYGIMISMPFHKAVLHNFDLPGFIHMYRNDICDISHIKLRNTNNTAFSYTHVIYIKYFKESFSVRIKEPYSGSGNRKKIKFACFDV